MIVSDIYEVFRPIAAEEPGHVHGSFLTHFARSLMHADPENFQIIRPAAEELIRKYRLDEEAKSFSSGSQ